MHALEVLMEVQYAIADRLLHANQDLVTEAGSVDHKHLREHLAHSAGQRHAKPIITIGCFAGVDHRHTIGR